MRAPAVCEQQDPAELKAGRVDACRQLRISRATAGAARRDQRGPARPPRRGQYRKNIGRPGSCCAPERQSVQVLEQQRRRRDRLVTRYGRAAMTAVERPPA